jgi:hypothetical protein
MKGVSVEDIMYRDFTVSLSQRFRDLSAIIGLVILSREVTNGNRNQVGRLRSSCIQDIQNLTIDRELYRANHSKVCGAIGCDVHRVESVIPFFQLFRECDLNSVRAYSAGFASVFSFDLPDQKISDFRDHNIVVGINAYWEAISHGTWWHPCLSWSGMRQLMRGEEDISVKRPQPLVRIYDVEDDVVKRVAKGFLCVRVRSLGRLFRIVLVSSDLPLGHVIHGGRSIIHVHITVSGGIPVRRHVLHNRVRTEAAILLIRGSMGVHLMTVTCTAGNLARFWYIELVPPGTE